MERILSSNRWNAPFVRLRLRGEFGLHSAQSLASAAETVAIEAKTCRETLSVVRVRGTQGTIDR